MAKGRAGVLGTGALRLPISSVGELPWRDIESAVGLTFSERDRQEIFRCYVAYHAHLSVEADRAPIAQVEGLRQTIVLAAQNLIDVLERFRPPSGSSRTDEDEALYSALAFSTTLPGFDLTAALRCVEPECRELLRGLGDGAVDLAVITTRPEVTALAAFFSEALKDATASAARSSPGYSSKPSAFEYSRWGVQLGPKSNRTATFAAAVLGREVTTAQVEHAFRIAVRQGAGCQK